MREYAIVPSKFWITPLAKSLRGNPAAQVVALYLKTGPHANLIGLYHCPIAYVAQDTGIPFEGASKALSSLSEAGYCTFDEQADVVFVHDMAPEQIGSALAPADKRTKAVLREWSAVPSEGLRRAFHRLYAEAFHLPPMPEIADLGQGASKAVAGPIEAPSKVLRSQDHDHEQENDHEQESSSSEQSPDGADSPGKGTKARKHHGTDDDHEAVKWMWVRIKVIDPTMKEPNWDAWANDMRLMREQDRRTHRDACALFDWANKDGFWKTNILSPAKLREKWQQLSLKRQNPVAIAASSRAPAMTDEQLAARNAEETAKAKALYRQRYGHAANDGNVIDAEATVIPDSPAIGGAAA